jgi:hypothetical protein
MKTWHVIADLEVDRKKLSQLFASQRVATLEPQTVTRVAPNNRGLLCHRDPELCFVVSGPDNLPDLLRGNNLINDVLPAPVYRAC